MEPTQTTSANEATWGGGGGGDSAYFLNTGYLQVLETIGNILFPVNLFYTYTYTLKVQKHLVNNNKK